MSAHTFPVTLVYATAPREVLELHLTVPEGTTLAGALGISGWRTQFELESNPAITYGIWGRAASLQTALRPHDRVELYRDLKVDPKVARRERFHKQGSKAAGLFAQRRAGAKAGY